MKHVTKISWMRRQHTDLLFSMFFSLSDWCFGTWLDYDFPYIGNVIIPTDELIFFRGVETTNQLYCFEANHYIISRRSLIVCC